MWSFKNPGFESGGEPPHSRRFAKFERATSVAAASGVRCFSTAFERLTTAGCNPGIVARCRARFTLATGDSAASLVTIRQTVISNNPSVIILKNQVPSRPRSLNVFRRWWHVLRKKYKSGFKWFAFFREQSDAFIGR